MGSYLLCFFIFLKCTSCTLMQSNATSAAHQDLPGTVTEVVLLQACCAGLRFTVATGVAVIVSNPRLHMLLCNRSRPCALSARMT